METDRTAQTRARRVLVIETIELAIKDAASHTGGRNRDDAWRWIYGSGEGIISFTAACEAAGVSGWRVRREAWQRMKPMQRRALRRMYGYQPTLMRAVS